MSEALDNRPTLQILGEMEVGEIHEFPISKMNSVKTMCSAFGLQWGKRFSTTIDRENKVLKVTREE